MRCSMASKGSKEALRKIGTAVDDIAKMVGRAVRIVRLEQRLGGIDRAACDFVEGRTQA